MNSNPADLFSIDAHGDVTQRVSNLGVLRTYRYDAFGNEKDFVPEDSNPFRYCGEYFDFESGDIYLRARYYDPGTGRFSSEDSVRSTSFKMPNGQEAEDPLSLNLYAYCHCSPAMHSDPTGKTIRSILAAIGSFTIGIGFGVMEAVTAGMSSEIESHIQMPNNAYAYMAGKIAANVAVGLIGMAVAGGGTAGGIVTSPTGVGAIAGANVAVVGGAVAVAAGAVAIQNAAMLGKMLSGDKKKNSSHYNGQRNPEGDFVYGNELTDHAWRHGKKMGLKNEDDYLEAARNFFEKDATDTMESFYGEDGNFYLYDTATNEFGVMNEFGGISSYYLPNDQLPYWLRKIRDLKK